TGPRHGVERPQQLAGARIPPANVAVETETRRLLAVVAADDDDVLIDRGRRRETEPAVDVAAHAGLEIDGAIVAETGRWLTALRIDGDRAIARPTEQSRRRVAIPGPVGNAAAAHRGRRRVLPDDLRGFRLEREGVLSRRER